MCSGEGFLLQFMNALMDLLGFPIASTLYNMNTLM